MTTYIVFVFVSLILIVGILINLFLGASQLTPLAQMYADEYLDANVKIGSVKATFFTSFPHIRIKANDVEIVSNALHTLPTDTVVSRRDTLLRVDEVKVGLNMLSLIQGDVKLKYLSLKEPVIRIVTDALGRNNYDIVKPDTASVDNVAQSDSSNSSIEDYLKMEHIRIVNGKFAFIDVPNNKSFRANGINLKLDGELSLKTLSADVEFSDRSTTLKYDGTRFLNRLPISMDGHIDCENFERYNLVDFHTNLGDLSLDVDGDIAIMDDSTSTVPPLDFNLHYTLSSPEVSTIFNVIPKEFVNVPVEIETGSVLFDGRVRGIYTANNYPKFQTDLIINDVKAHYTGMREKVDDLSVQMRMSIDDTHPDSSYINMDILHFKGGKSELSAKANLQRMFSKPFFKAQVKGHLDLNSLTNIFPVEKITMNGYLDANLTTSFLIDDVMKHRYANAKMSGKIISDNIDIRIAIPGDTILITDSTLVAGASALNPIAHIAEPDTFRLQTDLNVKFTGKDSLKIDSDIKRFQFDHPKLHISVSNLKSHTVSRSSRKDTLMVSTAQGDISMRRFLLRSDSITLAGRNIHVNALQKPSKANKYNPFLKGKFSADTLFAGILGTMGVSRSFLVEMAFEHESDTSWTSNGKAEIGELRGLTPAYSLPILASNIKIYQHNTSFDFKNITLRTGASKLSVNGEMHNLYKSIKQKQPFEAKVNIKADTIDVNEILSAIIEDKSERIASNSFDESNIDINTASVAIAPVDSARIDSLANQLVYISKRINFTLNTEAKKIKWSTLALRNVKGVANIVNRTLHVTNFMFEMGSGRAITTFSYRPSRRKKNASIDWFTRWERADIGDVVKASGLDTVMPMLQPLRGLVDCYVGAQVTIDSTLTPDLSSARISAHLGAQQLTLLDNETFAHISKILMFKNKKRNVIDTLSMNILVDSGKIEIPPFVLSMDRYRACVGGSQDLEMNMNYHVSILKSPLPFKAGVDIFGTPSNLEYDITKAKLKKYATDEVQKQNDDRSLAIRVDILRDSYRMSGLPLIDQLKTKEELEAEKNVSHSPVGDIIE
ncbi:MAG: AsmA family protein [Bacteroidia bacterium]|nr:AsmA family protein [Bacteroidia bacterium]